MKKTVSLVLSLLITLISSFSVLSAPDGGIDLDQDEFIYSESGCTVTFCGIPLKSHISDTNTTYLKGRSVWDLFTLEDGTTYIGSGDYDSNSGTYLGATPVYTFNAADSEITFKRAGSVADEAARRFKVIGGKLVCGGNDPTGYPLPGRYYEFNGTSWTNKNVLPGAVHNFDLLEYNGLIFSAQGSDDGAFISNSVSKDGGMTFKPVKTRRPVTDEATGEVTYEMMDMAIYTNDHKSQTVCYSRSYNLFEVGGKIYTTWYPYAENSADEHYYKMISDWSGAYVYNEETSTFDKIEAENISNIMYDSYTEGHQARFGDKVLFTKNTLHVIEDGFKISLPLQAQQNYETTHDVQVVGDRVFLLTSTPDYNKKNYMTKIYETGDLENYTLICSLETPDPALSMTIAAGHCYIGLGYYYMDTEEARKNSGAILRLDNETFASIDTYNVRFLSDDGKYLVGTAVVGKDGIISGEVPTFAIKERTKDKTYKFEGFVTGTGSKIDYSDITIDCSLYASFTEEDSPDPNARFKDVKSEDWFAGSVRFAVSEGLMSGMSETTFEPNTDTSRAMLVKILHNLEGQPEPEGVSNPFADVKAGEWYEKAVIWAYSKNITSGMSETSFAPSLSITREQFAAILYRYAQYKGLDTSERASLDGFSDAGSVSSYAVSALEYAFAKQFITGMSETVLNPRGNATRAQMASILKRFCLCYPALLEK